MGWCGCWALLAGGMGVRVMAGLGASGPTSSISGPPTLEQLARERGVMPRGRGGHGDLGAGFSQGGKVVLAQRLPQTPAPQHAQPGHPFSAPPRLLPHLPVWTSAQACHPCLSTRI